MKGSGSGLGIHGAKGLGAGRASHGGRGTSALAKASRVRDSVQISGRKEVASGLADISTMIFDMDGVIWRGSRLIDGAREAIESLEAQGRRVFYLTNNSAKSRAQCAEKLASFGIKASTDQVVCSSSSAARYLDSISFDKSKKVLVIGQAGILIELALSGYQTVTCEDLSPSSEAKCSIEEYEGMAVDEKIGAVVAGVDDSFTYRKLCIASLYLSTGSRDDPRVFVATNLDVGDRVGFDGRLIPGAGPVVASLERACGREAVNVGKGGSWLLPNLVEVFDLDQKGTCIVGDRVDTDIALGKEAGMVTILPLTGVTNEDDLLRCRNDMYPDLIVHSIAALQSD